MKWHLDDPVRSAGVTCVAVVEKAASVAGGASRIAGHGHKRPVLFLLFQGSDVSGVDLRGRTHDAASIERRFPSAIAKAAARIAQLADR